MLINLFQFQTGAIRSKNEDMSMYPISLFQFQTGAIRSGGHGENIAMRRVSFNSKLVRLEGLMLNRLMLMRLLVSIPNWCD